MVCLVVLCSVIYEIVMFCLIGDIWVLLRFLSICMSGCV